MASTYLTRTPSSAGDRKTFTFSTWIKRSSSSANQMLLVQSSSSSNFSFMRFKSDGTLSIYSESGGSSQYNFVPSMLFRDFSAWYHVVLTIDTTQATSTDRVKFYVNGSQITDFSTETYPSQNIDTMFNSTNALELGRRTYSTDEYLDGSLAHTHFIDGTAYAASTFGETDSTTGIWKPKTAPSVTYGTNGFFLKFASSGSMGTDSSGNGNNFTVGAGTLTQTQDTPSNVFATYNPLYKGNYTLSKGNLKSTISSGSDKFGGVSTFGVSSGKWYAEFKAQSASANLTTVGIFGNPQLASNNNQGVGKETNSISYVSDGQKYIENSASSYGASYTTNDIIGVALDLDSGTKTITFYKNGVSQGAITISLTPSDGVWFMASNSASAGATADWEANFGNGYFGTTAVSSAQSPSDGIGLFEYAVPSGYKALCTKSINSQEYS